MTLSDDLVRGFAPFFELLPVRTMVRGRYFQERGQVHELECLEPDRLFAATVHDRTPHQVGLEFTEGGWATECTCRVGEDCLHSVAALLELRKLAEVSRAQAPAGRPGPGKPAAQRAKPAARVAQPPSTPLADRLTTHLGRPLKADEARFIRYVQSLHQKAQYQQLTEADLASLEAGASLRLGLSGDNPWQPVELWPRVPRDDHATWLHLARELRRRQRDWPAFMAGITDLSVVEAGMKAWEHEKQMTQWREWFRAFPPPGAEAEPGMLEFRLALHPDEARLEWRADPQAAFAEVKSARAKQIAAQFSEGEVGFTPESLPLWSALYKPWDYENWWVLKYANAMSRPALNRLLRMALAPGCLVWADGRPLARPAEPLVLRLRPPAEGGGEPGAYELSLSRSDGSPPGRILCTLHGQPTLYLAEEGLFGGPAANALGAAMSKTIPAAALESPDGLRFLHTVRVPLPEKLQQRIRAVPVTVCLSCQVKPSYPGSTSEDICVAVAARAPGLPGETFTPAGWMPERLASTSRSPADGEGVITVHDRSGQRHFPRLLDNLGLKFDPYAACWRMRCTKKVPETFQQWLKTLPPEVELKLDQELATLRDEPLSGTVALDVTETDIDWFDLRVTLQVADTTLTPEELKLLLNARGGLVRLEHKGWRRLHFNLTPEEDQHLAKLGLDSRDFSAEPQRFHALQLADESARRFLGPDRVERLQQRVSELKTRVSPALPAAIRAELRPYQTEGFHFLAYLTANRFGGVLADDMGLGKTLQTLAWLAWLREAGPADAASGAAPPAARNAAVNGAANGAKPGAPPHCSLVICPKSVMDNWRTEAERFCPGLRVRVWRGEPAAELDAARASQDLIVINYAQLRALSPAIAGQAWLAAILDEAQSIKNPDSQTAQTARALRPVYRLALTGTPIENRLLDLWSIMAFAMPGALGNRSQFLRSFDAKDDPLARQRLAARVRPFLLRRAKSQVAKDLPDRVEEDRLCDMEGAQKSLYQAELKRARQIILGLESTAQLNEERFNILTSLLRLRQICCHPVLVDAKLAAAESAKLAALLDLLEPIMEEGHKVLVFSQFVTMLDLLRTTVQERGWPHFYLAGDTENRGELVREFQAAAGGAVFLISLKAGGFGLNLTAASYVVLFDPWWNPAVENQAIDRTHRIGQTSKVMAYRLLTRDTIEQKIRALQKQKAMLAADVLGEERFAQSLTLDDLRFLFAD